MNTPTKNIVYPISQKDPTVDNYHGTEVADPYRWLEAGSSPDITQWVKEQNATTEGILSNCPARTLFAKRFAELMNFERQSVPFKVGRRWFFSRNTGLQNQAVLYTTTRLNGKKPRVLLDPNTLSPDGTASLSTTAYSRDGKYLAYGISHAGSDWIEFRVRDISTLQDLPDRIQWVKFSGASWAKDGSGFYYSRFPEPKNKLEDKNVNQKIYFHKLGDSQENDTLIYERPDQPEWGMGGYLSASGKRLYIYVSGGASSTNRLFYKDLTKPEAPVVELFAKDDAGYSIVYARGSKLWVHTTKDAPKGRLVVVDLRKLKAGSEPELKEVIAEANETLEEIGVLGDCFYASYMKDAHTCVLKYAINDGSYKGEVALPGVGTAGGFSGDRRSAYTFISYTSFTEPNTIYRYDVASGKSTVYFRPSVKGFDPQQYHSEQVFYTSKDGTRVPMFICYKKGLVKDGNNPTLLYGYGGFNVSLTPSYSTSRIVWMEMGGIFAMPNLRGGGEYGEAWHKAGTKLQKQNVFDDFIAAAEFLIANKYTSSKKLAINGASNGGLLVGACMTQRPELFAVAVPEVGVLDMLRFHLFTIGRAWTPDYGCSDNADEFKALYAYSPLHNLRAGVKYPATMIMTADHDDRVVPAHSYKFAAALQSTHNGDSDTPVIIRIEADAGHGAGKPTSKLIAEEADTYSFIAKYLGMS